MPGSGEFGRLLIITGVVLVVLGVLFTVGGRLSGLGRLGNLPGDIVIRRGNFTFYFPIVTCIVLSLAFTVLLWLLRR